jgi:hypothetical protein
VTVRERWDRYWFAPSSAEGLALTRILCCALCFAIYLRLDIRAWTEVSPVFWMPVSLFRFLPGPPRDAVLIGLLQMVWKVSLFTAAIGLFTRVSLCAATLLGFFVLGLPNCFGKIHHLDGFVVLVLFILCASRCGDAIAIDRLLRKRRTPSPASSGDYSWPVRLGQTLFLLMFLAAGLSKLRHSGLAWLDPANMRFLLIANQFNHAPPTRWAAFIAQSDVLCSLAAVSTVVVELSGLPAIFFPAMRVPVVIALFGLQAAIAMVMGIYFTPHLVGYALFVHWNGRRWNPGARSAH